MGENDGMHNAYEFVINTVLRIHHFSIISNYERSWE